MLKKILRVLIKLVVLLAFSLWMLGALTNIPGIPSFVNHWGPYALVFALILAFLPRTRRTGYAGLTLIMAYCLFSFFSVEASNDRIWERSVEILPHAEVNGDSVTIHNIRNFQYRTETDFTPGYYDKTFDLNQISSVDFIAVYWAGKPIAHLMVSFGFADKDYITFTIETRKEASESYSTVKGFYRNYELAYVVADERDVIGLRTKIRQPNEQVYLFRARTSLNNSKKFFLSYVNQVNELYGHPQFYNTLTTNCTTRVLNHAQSFNGALQYNWKNLLSGYVPDLLYQGHAIDTSMPFEQLFTISQVNERANRDILSEGFSVRIREGLPRPPRRTLDTFDAEK